MKQFEDRLLHELKQVAAQQTTEVIRLSGRRSRWTGRLCGAVGLAAVLAVVLAVVLPTSGGRDGGSRAWAVTENDDGTVTVEIRDIRDADGLERKLEEVGVPAAVHYLPQDKLCAPPGFEERMRGDSTRMEREEAAMEAQRKVRGAVRISESDDGAFVFSIDRSKLEPDYTVVVFAEHDVPEHGQSAETVASIAPAVVKGDYYEECRLVDGSAEGWGFQDDAPPGDK